MDKIWNPYVNFENNEICIDILKNDFTPALTTPKVILSIISLLGESKI
jgi:ubiquitin-protein ligase